jgi:hypothetical protein
MPVGQLPHQSLEALVRDHLLADEDPGTAALIRRLRAARRRGYLTKAEFEAACRWKSPRASHLFRANTPRRIRSATTAALGTRDERRRLEALLTLRGISVPMASAVLTLLDPARYGVIDIRVWQLLHAAGAVEGNRAGTGFTFAHWSRFLDVIRGLGARFKMPARAIERAIFAAHVKYQEGLLYRKVRRRE